MGTTLNKYEPLSNIISRINSSRGLSQLCTRNLKLSIANTIFKQYHEIGVTVEDIVV